MGGDSQLELEATWSSYSEGVFFYVATCIPGPSSKKNEEVIFPAAKGHGGSRQTSDGGDDEEPRCQGSIIIPTAGAVGEKIEIPGTAFELYYFTNRVHGRSSQYQIDIPLYDSNPNVTGHKLYAEYVGGVINEAFNNDVPDFVYNFTWDGKDTNGNVVLGSTHFNYTITVRAHGKEIPVYYKTFLGGVKAEAFGFGLWTPSIYHFYDVARERLYRGDGTSRRLGAKVLNDGTLMVAERDASEVYIFDSNGRHLTTKFGLTGGNKYAFGHDQDGQLVSITEPHSQVTTFTIAEGRVTHITAPKGQVTQLLYDDSDYLSRVIRPGNEVYKISYYENGLIKRFEKPGEQASTFSYDTNGILMRDTHSSGFFQNISREISELTERPVTTLTTPMGRKTTFEIMDNAQLHNQLLILTTNSLGHQVIKRSEAHTETTFAPTYTVVESIKKDIRFPESADIPGFEAVTIGGRGTPTYYEQSVDLSDPNDPFSIESFEYKKKVKGKVNVSSYDGVQRLWTHTSPEGRKTKIKIDVHEKPIEQVIGNFEPIRMSYNSDGKLSAIVHGDRVTTIAYDDYGYMSSITDALGKTITYKNDINGRRVSSIAPDGREVKYEYDQNGNLISVTPPKRPKHSFILNAFEQLRAYLPPSLGGLPVKTEYFYNPDQQIRRIVRPDGKEISYGYNSTTGMLESIQTSSGEYTYQYSVEANDIKIATSPDGIAMDYLYHGPFRAEEYQYSTSFSEAGLRRGFDDEHRIASITVGDSLGGLFTASRTYDKDNLIIKNGWMSYERNHPQGLITKKKLDKAEIRQTHDDKYGELIKIEYLQDKTLQLFREYKRDLLGRISYERSKALGDYILYDLSGRFIGRQPFGAKSPSHEYRYDENGNRIWSRTPDGAVEATYDNQDRLLTWGDNTYTYNENGDLTSKTNASSNETTEYSYDVFGNLKSVTLPNDDVIQYETDADNRRVIRKWNGTITARYIYEDQLRVAAELDSSGQIVKHFVYGDSPNVPDYMTYDGERYIFVKDVRGSVLKVVNSRTGEVAQELEYDDWGKVLKDTNPGFQPFGFAGGLYDHQTGLVRFGARDYDPETGRWTAKDPIRFDGGDTNLYGYVLQDPINSIDVTGKFGESIMECAGDIYGSYLGIQAIRSAIEVNNREIASLRHRMKQQCLPPQIKAAYARRMSYLQGVNSGLRADIARIMTGLCRN